MARYAIYFAPKPDSLLWGKGCNWLGRDAARNVPNEVPHELPHVPGIPPLILEALTEQARRYGFHATLKAPFRLKEAFTESHLADMAQAFAEVQHPVALHGLRVRTLDGFLALRPSAPLDDINALAMRCVSFFDNLRAAPTVQELAKRQSAGLTQRQEALLQRWGYPYTEEEFRFHMTLTDSLAGVDEDVAYALRKAAEDFFDPALRSAAIDALTIFREEKPGAPFTVWKRFPFGGREAEPVLPESGQLFFLVGPSGVGKDSLLSWVQNRIAPATRIVFARRVITRPAHDSETHEPVDESDFWKLAADGRFAMIWEANGLCYGIPRGIEADLKAGRNVVVNGSREYVPQLRQAFPEARVIWVEADVDQIRRRVEARRREAGPALLHRLDRIGRFAAPEDGEVIRLDNSGPLELAGKRLLEVLAS